METVCKDDQGRALASERGGTESKPYCVKGAERDDKTNVERTWIISMKKKEHMQTPIRWLYEYNKKYLWAVLLLALVAAGISGGFILLALVSRKILDIATGSAKGSIPVCCMLLLGIIGLQAILNIINANLRIRVMTGLEMNLRQRMFTLLLRKQYAEVKQIHSGEILNRLTSDIDIIVSGIIDIIPQFISIMTRLAGGLAVLFVVDYKFTFVILMIGLLVVFCSRLYSGRYRSLHKEVQRTNGKVRSFLQECVENIVVIKSFVNEEPIRKQLDSYQQRNYQVRKKRTAISNVANTVVYVLFTSGYYAALVWGALHIATGQMTFGTVTAFLQIIDQIKAPFRNMSGLLPQYYSMTASAERLMELEALPEEEYYTDIQDVERYYEDFQEICLEDATFFYEDGEKVLEHADLTIQKGTFMALIGASGAGKSTLIKLLLNLAKVQKGHLYLETKTGRKEIDAGMRALFAYVPQGNLMLSGSIRENIVFGNQKVSEAEMRKAAEIACIAEDIETFPEGYDTILGERGIGLSEGQAQRLAIARAILSEAPILLLDECTSALDSDTEERLLENLKQLEHRTILCISHKDATIHSCDEIVRLEDYHFVRVR